MPCIRMYTSDGRISPGFPISAFHCILLHVVASNRLHPIPVRIFAAVFFLACRPHSPLVTSRTMCYKVFSNRLVLSFAVLLVKCTLLARRFFGTGRRPNSRRPGSTSVAYWRPHRMVIWPAIRAVLERLRSCSRAIRFIRKSLETFESPYYDHTTAILRPS